jgi:hypothetical protein
MFYTSVQTELEAAKGGFAGEVMRYLTLTQTDTLWKQARPPPPSPNNNSNTITTTCDYAPPPPLPPPRAISFPPPGP